MRGDKGLEDRAIGKNCLMDRVSIIRVVGEVGETALEINSGEYNQHH